MFWTVTPCSLVYEYQRSEKNTTLLLSSLNDWLPTYMQQKPYWRVASTLAGEDSSCIYGIRMFITMSATARHLSLSWARIIHWCLPTILDTTKFNSNSHLLLGFPRYIYKVSRQKFCKYFCFPLHVPHTQPIIFSYTWSPSEHLGSDDL